MSRSILFIIISFSSLLIFSQSKRDIIIRDSLSFYQRFKPDTYQQMKRNVLELEEEYGYEPELKYNLLGKMYDNRDIGFLKQELTVLVRDYGFNYTYVNKATPYYKAITEGELKDWFKEMYLKNHFIWMEKNFDKQQDIYVINHTGDKSVLIESFGETIKEKLELTKKQKEKLENVIDDMCFANITELYQITRNNNFYPTGKSYGLIQKGFKYTISSSLLRKRNIERFWILFYPYLKKAYINNEIDYSVFRNYDYQNYRFFGYQHFGLLHPDQFTNDDGQEIPIKDIYFYSAIKKEFNWE